MSVNVPQEAVLRCINAVLEQSARKPWGFPESVLLHVGLKKFDPRKDKTFRGSFTLKHVPKAKFQVCVFADEDHCIEARDKDLVFMDKDTIRRLSKSINKVNKLPKKYDGFLASSSLVNTLPGVLRRVLREVRKEPVSVANGELLTEKIEELKTTAKFRVTKLGSLCVRVGNVKMPADALAENVNDTIVYLESLLTHDWQNVKSLKLMSSKGSPQRLL
ncbi:hypothetical protein HPB48_022401 [Haemaphysalis longicornis]|uniref:Large ribosomal subunit protein uL1 n=1 Tax=Haemaphysalis longicornis TaxID=44386 RepID=A0A9J6GBD3_HAELO|nr:hypothetical protein HPB48_022401 [Haemaphysalis longicornis]